MGAKNTVLPGGQPPIVAFTVLAQLCGRKANETEMDAALFTKNSKGNNFDFEIIFILKNNPCCAFVMSVRDALVANKSAWKTSASQNDAENRFDVPNLCRIFIRCGTMAVWGF